MTYKLKNNLSTGFKKLWFGREKKEKIWTKALWLDLDIDFWNNSFCYVYWLHKKLLNFKTSVEEYNQYCVNKIQVANDHTSQ